MKGLADNTLIFFEGTTVPVSNLNLVKGEAIFHHLTVSLVIWDVSWTARDSVCVKIMSSLINDVII
jgi:hypothetical protein